MVLSVTLLSKHNFSGLRLTHFISIKMIQLKYHKQLNANDANQISTWHENFAVFYCRPSGMAQDCTGLELSVATVEGWEVGLGRRVMLNMMSQEDKTC